MAMYMYVDGESHFLRSRQCWKELHGEAAELQQAKHIHFNGPTVVDPKAKIFWNPPMRNSPQCPARAVYFTSVVGDADEVFKINLRLRRGLDMEPFVVQETKQLAKNRDNALQLASIIEKPKGVDIALSVRMLQDAYSNNYDMCVLVSSDVDFLPVIEAVRRMGKTVMVAGYKNGLATKSPLLYVPDNFYDMGPRLKEDYRCLPAATESIQSLGEG